MRCCPDVSGVDHLILAQTGTHQCHIILVCSVSLHAVNMGTNEKDVSYHGEEEPLLVRDWTDAEERKAKLKYAPTISI